MKGILIGAVIAGIVIFAWGAVSHMVLPLGEMGLKSLANEEPVLAALRGAITEPGLYFYPSLGLDFSAEMTGAQQAEWEKAYLAGPTGMILYHPGGEAPMSPKQLITELFADMVAALFAGLILARVAGSTTSRAVTVGVMGVFAWFTISMPYWNWYHFPGTFVTAELIDQVVGWTLAGFVLAKFVKPQAV